MVNRKLRRLSTMLFAVAMIFCSSAGAFAEETAIETDYIYAAYPGEALPLYNGECVEIDEGALFAAITRDRAYLVTWFADGRLTLRDIENDREALISENCSSLSDVRDSGLLYVDGEGDSYRVLFDNASRLKLGKILDFKLADNTMSMLYADAYDNILSLAENESEPAVLGKWGLQLCLDGISDDGKLAVWTEMKGSTGTVCLSENGKKTVLGETDSKYCGTFVRFSADEKLLIVASTYGDSVWLKQRGRMPKKAYMQADVWHADFFCDEGSIEKLEADDIEYVYASSEGELYNNFFCLRMNGNAKPILSEVLVYGVAGGRILYEKESGLYIAELKEGSVSGEKKLSDSASRVRISPDGKYAYYLERDAEGADELVCCSLNDGKTFRMAEDAVVISDNYQLSPDGKTVFFYGNAQRIFEIGLEYYAELYMWTWGDKQPKLIDSDVIIDSVSSGLAEGVDSKAFSYVKYLGTDTEDNILGTLIYFEDEAKVIAAEIIY